MKLLDPRQPIPGLGVRLGDFWQWAYSDILSNLNRAIFAEYLVGVALGVVGKARNEWDPVDLYYRKFKIEVKSSAYWQSWSQKNPSIIRFSIRKARVLSLKTGVYGGRPTRCADLYVFCHYSETDEAKVNVLNIPGWDFYVISTAVLNRDFAEAKSLSLSSVKGKSETCQFDKLKEAVDQVLGRSPEPLAKATTTGGAAE